MRMNNSKRSQESLPTLFIFAKDPALRPVKTRLAASIGTEKAKAFFEDCLDHLLQMFPKLNEDLNPMLLLEPLEGEQAFRKRFGYQGKIDSQAPGDLGEKLYAAFQGCSGPAMVVGTDLPELSASDLKTACTKLRSHQAVLGPCDDGGYFLLGTQKPQPELFTSMPWSTPEVLGETKSRIAKLDLSLAMLKPIEDIDTIEDLKSMHQRMSPDHPFFKRAEKALGIPAKNLKK